MTIKVDNTNNDEIKEETTNLLTNTSRRTKNDTDGRNEFNSNVKKLIGVNYSKVSPLTAKCCEELKSLFHGSMDRSKATPLLINNGDFLIRLAKSIDDLLYKPVLSCKWNNKYYHFLIKERYQLFWIENLQFSSILSLCNYYLKSGQILTKNSGVKLLNPIHCQLWNSAIGREQKFERQQVSGSFELADDKNVIQNAKSLTYILFGENVPYILNYIFAFCGFCLGIIIFYILSLFE